MIVYAILLFVSMSVLLVCGKKLSLEYGKDDPEDYKVNGNLIFFLVFSLLTGYIVSQLIKSFIGI